MGIADSIDLLSPDVIQEKIEIEMEARKAIQKIAML